MPATITNEIIGLLSPQSAANLSQTAKYFHDLTAKKRWADYSEHIIKPIADYNEIFSHRGTPVRLVRAWLTLGKTEWVGALDMDGAATIAQAIIMDEKKHPKLTSIAISMHKYQQHDYDFNRVLEHLLSDGGGENLKTINIGTDYWFGHCPIDRYINLVADCCPNLTSITVEGSSLTDKSIKRLAKCTLLEHVDLEGTSDIDLDDKDGVYCGICDAGIIALAENCKNLKYLNAGLSRLGDESLIALGENCQKLSWIRIYDYDDKAEDVDGQTHYGPVGLKALTEGNKFIKISYRQEADVPN